MNYKISKKAAAELKDLLASKDTANILYQWYLDQERDGWEVTPSLMAKRIQAKLRVLQIEIRLHEEFGIELFTIEQLNEWIADYSEMLDNIEANIAREAA